MAIKKYFQNFKVGWLCLPIVGLVTVLIAMLGLYNYQHRVPISPDESQNIYFSQLLSETGSLKFQSDLNEHYSDKIFGSRQYIQIGDATMPSTFLGYIVELSFLRTINDVLVFIAGALFAAIAFLYIYLLSRHLFNEKVALTALMLSATSAPILYWSVSLYCNIAELAFCMAALYYLVRLRTNNSTSTYVLFAIFIVLAIWQRYTNILLLGLAILPYLYLIRKQLALRGVLSAAIVAIILISPIFIMNYQLYGSPLSFGSNSPHQFVYPYIEPGVPDEKLPLVPFRSFEIMIKNIYIYYFVLMPIIIIAAFVTFIQKLKTRIRSEIVLFGSVFIVWSLYYLGGYFFGYGDNPILSSSYTRYLLFVYAILTILAAVFISSMKPYYIKYATIFGVSLLSVTMFAYSERGVLALYSQIEGSHRWLSQVQAVSKPDSVFFVKGADKALFPSRQTALYQMLSKNRTEDEAIDRTLVLMRQIVVSGKEVYFVKEDNFDVGYPSKVYLDKLNSYGLRVGQYYGDLLIYRIEAQP